MVALKDEVSKAKVNLSDIAFRALCSAACGGHIGVMQVLLNARAEPNPRTWARKTPLQGAIMRGYGAAV